jgi:hypothetical protein
MKPKGVGTIMISPLNLGTCVSYEMRGDQIIIRFLGIITVGKIQVQDIRELRQATRAETSSIAFALNELLFYFWRPAYRPIYLMKTRQGKYFFLKLSHCSQKQLRMAIRRFREPAGQLKKAA